MEISIGKARRGQLSDPLPGQAYVGRPAGAVVLVRSAALPCRGDPLRSNLAGRAAARLNGVDFIQIRELPNTAPAALMGSGRWRWP